MLLSFARWICREMIKRLLPLDTSLGSGIRVPRRLWSHLKSCLTCPCLGASHFATHRSILSYRTTASRRYKLGSKYAHVELLEP